MIKMSFSNVFLPDKLLLLVLQNIITSSAPYNVVHTDVILFALTLSQKGGQLIF